MLDCWGNRSVDVVAEKGGLVDAKFSFLGQHRVRLFRFWDNVHFKLPPQRLDISKVAPAQAPTPPRPVTVSPHGKKGRGR